MSVFEKHTVEPIHEGFKIKDKNLAEHKDGQVVVFGNTTDVQFVNEGELQIDATLTEVWWQRMSLNMNYWIKKIV